MLKTLSAILTGKSIFTLSRILKLGGGYAAPGLYSLKLDPNLVEKLVNRNAKNIIITGTNGKTTTSNLVSQFLNTPNTKLLKNSSGSNLERGIASYLVKNANIKGKTTYDFGIWELDEFAFNSVAPKIKPDAIILLNAFRDQLDRYGEVDNVIKKWQTTLEKLSPDTLLIVNQDDSNILKAVKNYSGKIIKFGLKDQKITGENKSTETRKPDYEAEVQKNSTLNETSIKLKFNGHDEEFKLPLPGVFNAYNFLAAFTLAHMFNIDLKTIKSSLENFSPSFGRFEKFKLGNIEGNIFLIKNPVGTTQVLKTISPHITQNDTLLIALNDNFADGTDVSWIWDIDLENLKFKIENLKLILTGSRAYDMALRFKYADFKNIDVEPNLEQAFNRSAKETEGKLFLLPTYTALIELQKIMVEKGIKKEYWKE